MATAVAAPYGLVPVKKIDNTPFSGAVGTYRVQSGYATALHFGTPVQYTGGYITALSDGNAGTTTTPDEVVGVFMGCSYTDPNTSQKVWRQHLPASVVASDIEAYVADDANTVFKAQVSTTAFDALANIGKCYALSAASGGSSTTGKSSLAIDTDGTPAAGNTLPIKLVGLAAEPGNTNAKSGEYIDVLVMISPAFHIFANNNG